LLFSAKKLINTTKARDMEGDKKKEEKKGTEWRKRA
jgi:hypothetical protein